MKLKINILHFILPQIALQRFIMFKLITILHENFTIFKSCFFKTGQIDYGVVKKVPWFISIQHHSAFQFLLSRFWTGLLLVQRRVATHLHGHPLAAEDDVAGRGTVQGLQLLLCNMSSLICQTVVMFVITVMIFNLKVSYHSLDHFV